jgi:hypothetical protein
MKADVLEDMRAIYDELAVNLTYYPDGRVHVGAGGPCTWGSCRRGDLRLDPTDAARPDSA